jgi:HEAT repeat protein
MKKPKPIYSVEQLSALLKEASPEQSRLALKQIAKEALQPLSAEVEPLCHSKDVAVRSLALWALVRSGKEAYCHLYRSMMTDREPLIRRHCMEALGLYGHEDDLPALSMATRDMDGTVKNAALIAVELIITRGQAPGTQPKKVGDYPHLVS